MDGLCWLYNHRAHVVSSLTELDFLTYMNQKQKFTSPSAIQVKNRQTTVSTDQKLDVIRRLERLELQTTVKAAVSMGDLTAHHYGPLSHPVSCQCTYTNPYFNSGSHHHPFQQTRCVLPWYTEPCVTAKRPFGEFLKTST